MAEADDYLANLRNQGTNSSIQVGVSAKPRQGIKMDPTDDAHMVTHQPPSADGGPSMGMGSNDSDGKWPQK